MKGIKIVSSLLVLLLVICGTYAADCDQPKNPDDSDITSFFKNLGCKVAQGAETVVEVSKPYAKKIGDGAKDLGSTVAQKYDELKHKLTDEAVTPSPQVQQSAPTERVLLAPIAPALPAEISNPQPITAA